MNEIVPAESQLTISRRALEAIIFFEITSRAYYEKELSHPEWPGLGSGITIGIGYDLGYNSPGQVAADWSRLLPAEDVTRLVSLSGLKGEKARQALTPGVKTIQIPYPAAEQVFIKRSLPRYAKDTMAAYPGVELLLPDAVGGLVSLVFNRGNGLKDDPKDKNQRRREMRAIKPLVATKDYQGIALQIRTMKRLWDGIPNYNGAEEKRAGGLLIRRHKEADLVANAIREYKSEELINIELT